MQVRWRNGFLAVALTMGMIPVGLSALTPPQQAETVYTGVVSDAMCGAKHSMGNGTSSDAACTRMCVGGGSDYALVVGQKAYTLKTTNKQFLATLNKYAGERVVVKGKLTGENLAVASVAPAHR